MLDFIGLLPPRQARLWLSRPHILYSRHHREIWTEVLRISALDTRTSSRYSNLYSIRTHHWTRLARGL